MIIDPGFDEFDEFDEVDDGDTVWRFERSFMTSNWTCIWGRGCLGIGETRDAETGHGCCSLGAELDGEEEAMNLAALASTLSPDIFQFHHEATTNGIFRDADNNATRVIDGACIFHNRAGFMGGQGCALHLGALAYDESPIDWKPSVCWQLPIKVDWVMRDDEVEVATVRGWQLADWGDHSDKMAWCCTQEPEAYVGTQPVIESLAEELTAIVGERVFVELRTRFKDK
jgi:hypothetical protein